MKRPLPFAILSLASALILSACDPAFKTTADLCASGQNGEVIIGLDFTDPDTSPYITEPGRNNGEYRLYLQDILEAAVPTEVITAETQDALDAISALLNGSANDEFGLNYEMDAGLVTAASNPIDYIEWLMASTSDSTKVGAFEDARSQIGQGIASDDGFCNYTNRNIRFVDQDGASVLFSELNLSYNPFSLIVQQSFLLSELQSGLSAIEERQTVPYFGFLQASSDSYKTEGFYPFRQRSILVNSPDKLRSLLVDDGKDINVGQVEISTKNVFCEDEEGEIVACDDGVVTRVPAKTQCSDPDGTDETGILQVYSLALDDTLNDLKRIRLETDYETQEVRIYASEYNEAIYDSDGTTEIHDPTNCEKQAVLDELAALTPGVGVRLTVIEDPNYDLIYDDDGNITTTPLYTFTGTELP